MVQEGDVVYCLVKREDEATLKVGGTVVEAKGDTVVIASPKHSVQGVPNSLPRCLGGAGEGGVDQQWSRETSYSSRRKTQKLWPRIWSG